MSLRVHKHLARSFKTGLGGAFAKLNRQLKRPGSAAALTGLEVVGTAVAVGAAQTALAMLAGWIAYHAIERRHDETPTDDGRHHEP